MKKSKRLKFNSINVGTLGLNPVDIPIVTLGEGDPKIVIICGMHGDEKSGLFIAEQLLDSLKDISLKGEVNVVLAANSWAQALSTRGFPIDNTDINRIFPGDVGGSLPDRLAAALINFCKQSTLVIDLHTFEGLCPVVGLFMNAGTKKFKNETIEILKVFGPDAVWKLNFALPDEVKLSGALGPILANEGVLNFAVETMQHTVISQDDINKVVNSIVSVLKFFEMVPGEDANPKKELLLLERRNIRAEKSGLFISSKKVMSGVKKGEKIGELISMPGFARTDVSAPCSGTLVINKRRDFVSTGDQLFSIGVKTSLYT